MNWINVKDEEAPPMRTVLLAVEGKVIAGWNESVQPEEDPSYCSWEHEEKFGIEGVTHWMKFPDAPAGEGISSKEFHERFTQLCARSPFPVSEEIHNENDSYQCRICKSTINMERYEK